MSAKGMRWGAMGNDATGEEAICGEANNAHMLEVVKVIQSSNVCLMWFVGVQSQLCLMLFIRLLSPAPVFLFM